MATLKEQLKKRLFTVQEASTYLGRSVPSLRELYYDGEMPVVRVGRSVHFDLSDLDRWIEQHKVKFEY